MPDYDVISSRLKCFECRYKVIQEANFSSVRATTILEIHQLLKHVYISTGSKVFIWQLGSGHLILKDISLKTIRKNIPEAKKEKGASPVDRNCIA